MNKVRIQVKCKQCGKEFKNTQLPKAVKLSLSKSRELLENLQETISSQAEEGSSEGSTTRAYNLEQVMELQECVTPII